MTTPEEPMKILALCGSLRGMSISLKAISIAEEEMSNAGAHTTILCGSDMLLPLYGYRDEDEKEPAVDRLRKLAMEADGFLLATPEYHSNMSAAMKNALDWLDCEHFEGKPSALIAVAGGAGSHNALNSLRTTIRAVHGWVLPEQVQIGASSKAFDAGNRPLSADIEKRLHELGRSLVRAARALKQMRES